MTPQRGGTPTVNPPMRKVTYRHSSEILMLMRIWFCLSASSFLYGEDRGRSLTARLLYHITHLLIKMVNMNTRRQITDTPRPMYVMALTGIARFSGNEVGFKSCNREKVKMLMVHAYNYIARH